MSSKVYRTQLLKDTLKADNNRSFLYNNINIFNLTDNKISVVLNISPPEGWELTTQKVITISLEGNENTIVNLRMLPSGSKTADWQTFNIEYRLNNGAEILKDSFHVKVEEFTKFKATLPHSNYVMTAHEKNVYIPVSVTNRGNTTHDYFITFSNNLLNLNYTQTITLKPTEDTTYNLPLRISDAQWNILRNEQIKVQVKQAKGETYNLIQTISKVGYMLRDHKSGFMEMPLQVETGFTSQGANDLQYYGALHGRLEFTPYDRLAFDLRSNTYTQGQVIKNSILRAEYEGQKWYGTIGNVNELTDFIMDGYGVIGGYKWKGDRNQAKVYGLLQSRTGNSNLIGGDVKYGISDKISMADKATVNLDRDNKINSYIIQHTAKYKVANDKEINIIGGTGLEQATSNITNTNQTSQIGTSIGYKLLWNTKYYSIVSDVLYNSNSYPGIFKGQRLQSHDGRLMYKNTFIGGFYDYTFRAQNIYQDTTYFDNVFNLRTQNYGARTGVSFKGGNVSLSAGKQHQLQSADTSYNPEYIFSYLNLSTSITAFKNLHANISSYYGRGHLSGAEDLTGVNVLSNQGSIQYDFIGVSGRYDIGPYYYHDYIRFLQDQTQQFERIIISPYLETSLFKHSLSIRTQFSYAKSLPSAIETSNLLTNIVYTNYRRGFDLNVSGIIPIEQKEVQPYVNVSFRVRLVAPFLPVRKYYQLKLVLFKDANANEKLDEGEEVIPGQTIAINSNKFVSNGNGHIIYKNIDKGDYKADYGFSSKVKGWIPSGGTIQHYNVSKNKTVYVPFKKSKVLSGKLKLIKDRNSNLEFKLSNIKITAMANDTLNTYSTLTNDEGEFYFNLPSGTYTVTISQAAFGDQFKPTEFAKQADLLNNDEKTIYFEIKQKRRAINIKRKKK
ncbi:MAG: carboxypeptidase-like regulatory domain-containing protein [Flavipsychrobacter sp.]